MNLFLPELKPTNASAYILSAKIVGNIIFSSGSTALVNGKTINVGIVGKEVTIEQAQEAAIVATLNTLAKLKDALGDLGRIKNIIKVNGFIASASDFNKQAIVMNTVSDLLIKVFGSDGAHARTAVGVSSLPGGSPVEVEIIAEFE
mgnify:CR=1 FL=1